MMAEKNDDFSYVNKAWIQVNGGYSIHQAVDMEEEQKSEGTDSNDIDDFCHVYRGWTQINKISESYSLHQTALLHILSSKRKV